MKTLLTFAAVTLVAVSSLAQESQQANSTLTDDDRLQIAVQKICPVSGEALDSMGEPIKVKIGKQVGFLCCEGCQGKELDAEHWRTIQTNLATAQGTCPIMDKPVDASMKSTVVNGKQIFVCCPPCIAKIQADVEGSLKKVNASYASFVAKEQTARSDQLHATAQGICPVTGKKLGSMGDPIKVKVGEEEVAFLCCKGCVGEKINAEHWATIQTNLATAQKVCPVMGKAVDASMESTVVNGRKIYVCCPPCIDKIKADPATYIAKLDAQIAGDTQDHQGEDDHNHADHKHDR